MQPPHLTALPTASCPLTYVSNSAGYAEKSFSRNTASFSPSALNPSGCFAFGALSVGWYVSLLFEASETPRPRLRNFDTHPHSSYCYEVESDNRLESVANAHTAADLHVRPVSRTALVSRAVGAANAHRDTSCLVSRNGNDSTKAPGKTSSHSRNQAAEFVACGKRLNLRRDSKHPGAVIFHAIAQNKFTNSLRLSEANRNFRTTLRHYADK
jgi:hypothetical protein